MKTPLLIGVSALALLTLGATLFAQTTTGSSLITEMKAGLRDFTLAGQLNPGITGLQSAPVGGKKTGDMLTAGEWNRVLELVAQGGGGSGGLKICGENENCAGTVLLCGAVSPEPVQTTADRIQIISSFEQPVRPITFGTWSNTQCGKSGTGWHAALATCSTGQGTGFGKCEWVLVDTGGGGGGSGMPIFTSCTIENSDGDGTDDKAPCVAAAQNGGQGNANYRPMNCYNRANTGIGSGTLLAWRSNRWEFEGSDSVWNSCDDGSVIVMNLSAGAGGGGGGAGWVNVPATDTADFDLSCIYRVIASGSVMGGGNIMRYSTGVQAETLFFGFNLNPGWMGGFVSKATKGTFGTNSNGTYTVNKLEKFCAGTGGGSGGGGGLGYGQTWQNMKGSAVGCAGPRISGTICTNNTGKPIQVNVSAAATEGQNVITFYCYAGTGTDVFLGLAQRFWNGMGDSVGSVSFVVPVGGVYHCDMASNLPSTVTWSHWVELR